MFNWFKKKTKITATPLLVDMHSHLLPGLDDGVQTIEEAYQIITYFRQLGYTRLITTPHVMSDIYRNTSAGILEKLNEVQEYLKEKNAGIELQAAAEYYLDESLMKKIADNERLLTFGDGYLLFETNFLTEPFNLKEFIFQASSRGYKLVLAHPERYLYLHRNFEKAEDLLNRGVLFQINISSLTGYYSRQSQSMSYQLIERGWVHMLGSDCHHKTHAELVKRAAGNKYFQKALTLPLLNNTLA